MDQQSSTNNANQAPNMDFSKIPEMIQKCMASVSEEDKQRMQEFMKNMSQNWHKNHKGKGQGYGCGMGKNNGPWQGRRWGNWRRDASCDSTDENTIYVPLKRFSAETIEVKVNDKALMTISGTGQHEEETNRNGMRKVTSILEETIQLPAYLLEGEDKLLAKVTTEFKNGGLYVKLPEKPKSEEEMKADEQAEKKDEPIDIKINFV